MGVFVFLLCEQYRITESLRLEKTSKIMKSNRHPIPTMPAKPSQNHRMVAVGRDLCGSSSPTKQGHLQQANHVPKCRIYTCFEPLQGRGLHHCPAQPGPTPDRSSSKDIFLNIQCKRNLRT